MPLFKFNVKDRENVWEILEKIKEKYPDVEYFTMNHYIDDDFYAGISGGEDFVKSIISEIDWKSCGIQAPQYMKPISVLELLSGK